MPRGKAEAGIGVAEIVERPLARLGRVLIHQIGPRPRERQLGDLGERHGDDAALDHDHGRPKAGALGGVRSRSDDRARQRRRRYEDERGRVAQGVRRVARDDRPDERVVEEPVHRVRPAPAALRRCELRLEDLRDQRSE